jgi:hypothetical protein
MDRLGAMLPVSDGLSQSLNPDPDDGLAFPKGEDIDAWPLVCPSGNPPSVPDEYYPSVLVCPDDEMLESNLQEAKDLNSSGTRIDITVAWRHRDPIRIPPRGGEPCLGDVGECCSGRGHFDPPLQSRYASACGGGRNGVQNTAPIMAQEIVHNFGVVAKDSPHVDSGAHSKDLLLVDPFAFDFVRLRPYSAAPPGPLGSYLGDVMSIAWQQGFDLTLFSAYDWEHLVRDS